MRTLTPRLRDAALRWAADDPDPATRAELQRVLAAALAGEGDAAADLAERMSGPLVFGTAGLRGPVRAGSAGMNVAVVRRASAGLAAWLRDRGDGGGVVVVGRDARHGSAAFATAAAGVLAGAGFAVRTLPDPAPTPLVAFAVRELGAVAGVAITASHNPAPDNGYKVYLADGAQLAPPADAEIETRIAAAPAAVSIPTATGETVVDVTESYLDRVARLPRGPARALRIALTPLHGVGGSTAVHALARAGFTGVHVVAGQAAPDPDFPTVAFPNPEEPGATDALLELAAAVGADLAIALDPDADRCALGVAAPDGTWRMLTGDETGVLLGDHILRAGGNSDPLVVTTVVSSSMLRAVAAAHGARYAETLTGFKWIARGGPGLVYGYEEALGYCVDPDAVRDKDGIAASVLAADLAATLRARGQCLLDRLDELAVAHGVHHTEGLAFRLKPAARDAVVDRLHGAPPAGWTLERPAPDVLVLRRGGERVVVRPSGTEPKLKVYLQVVEPVAGRAALADARARAADRLAALRTCYTRLVSA
ncbi:phospho-sugar mutase [Pseudonocardia asaccharolytica]|uniref:Phosphoglucomutase n=1 Tax=Pseudonocardia asaccharolytica DSM 44247 = NBRC 16224 TaxID=1123024 RepID=A0A511CUA7_9PSEU|nr:phospho-sugar mutase [Pseudonocardia asaccharolytica]GEL16169.1 phosphoglucomutase [Pseudonocardia asaccharolytica DSM 44247 = NBRC 16224]